MQSSRVSQLLEVHRVLPRALLRSILSQALRGVQLTLCLHRVRLSPMSGPLPSATTSDAAELDALIELLLSARSEGGERWLTVSFDDGYADAVEYVSSRHGRWPSVDWLLFVCPAKQSARTGFRWDLPPGSADPDPSSGAYDVALENHRADLRGLADKAECRLATLAECQRVAGLDRVSLGNHTNCHFRQTGLSLEAARQDIVESARDFERLFGPTRHFAFPFGTPRTEYTDEHVELAQSAGYDRIWSTEARPFRADEAEAGVALPRMAIFGDWPVKKLALYVAVRATRSQLRRRGHVPSKQQLTKPARDKECV